MYERLTQVWPWHLLLNDFHLIGELTSIELFGNKYIYPDNSTHWQLKFVRDRITRHTGRSFFVADLAWDLGYDGYLQVKSKNLIEKYKEELRKLADSENKVLFPTTKDPLYSSMTNWAYRHGGSINQLITALGFTRVYKRENPFQDILLPFDRPEPGEDDLTDKSLEERLKRLKRLQGVLDKTKAGQYRLSRCRELVDELKKLYKNRCQLCGEENGKIPFIEKDNGNFYSEMHHIVSLSEIDNLEDEWKFLDTYQNAMICCAHHHKYLHHHHGGFTKKVFEDGQLFLESRKGTRIRIIENLHLTEK